MSRLFRCAFRSAVLRLIFAAALPSFSANAMAEQSGQLEPVQLPWKNTPDEIVVNLATGSLRESMLGWLKTERGVHAETLMVAIGALAGFAGQNAVWTRIAKRDVPLPPGADKSISGEALYDHLRDSGLFVVGRTKS